MSTIAKRTIELRENAGLSQSELARRIGVKPQSIQQLEAGSVRKPGYIVALAETLGVTPKFLATGKGNAALLSRQPKARHGDCLPEGSSPDAVALRFRLLRHVIAGAGDEARDEFAAQVGVLPHEWAAYEDGSEVMTREQANDLLLKFGVTPEWLSWGDDGDLSLTMLGDLVQAAQQYAARTA